ncbi:hypothetical protein IGI04_017746 [Brassica rapa subsp. trilocularis]|uniref:SKP1 component dimerisation domain-containing protein n=1 Tax=Brassica rapa subsp. trilocularis TaxID=1813537 RepID=A0ABQ7MAY0_BRACM|nr:hypothetical protein IGI04_017746 [Brassica rapa subsp. trilocularis]
MSESDLDIMKPETMKSYIYLQTADGSVQQVEQEVAMFCPMICQEVIHNGAGSSKNHAISLPQRVNTAMFSLILDYCRFHQVPGRSNKERKIYDEKFMRMETKRLCELTSAADSLQLKPLVDLTSRALARIIEGKSPEEIRDIFHLPDDLTEEEKLEPLKNTMDDPRIRLLNRLYAKKRKELKERERLKNVEVEEHVDERSVDDLLSFINGRGVEDTGCRMRDLSSLEDEIFTPNAGCEDDEIDPAMKEMLDREVEDFARRLNSNWVQSLGQERRPVHFSINGNGTTRRHIGQPSGHN